MGSASATGEPVLPGAGPQPRPEDLPASTATPDEPGTGTSEFIMPEQQQAAAEAIAKAKNKAEADRPALEQQERQTRVQLEADERNARFAQLMGFPEYHIAWWRACDEQAEARRLADAADSRMRALEVALDEARRANDELRIPGLDGAITRARAEYRLNRQLERVAADTQARLENIQGV